MVLPTLPPAPFNPLPPFPSFWADDPEFMGPDLPFGPLAPLGFRVPESPPPYFPPAPAQQDSCYVRLLPRLGKAIPKDSVPIFEVPRPVLAAPQPGNGRSPGLPPSPEKNSPSASPASVGYPPLFAGLDGPIRPLEMRKTDFLALFSPFGISRIVNQHQLSFPAELSEQKRTRIKELWNRITNGNRYHSIFLNKERDRIVNLEESHFKNLLLHIYEYFRSDRETASLSLKNPGLGRLIQMNKKLRFEIPEEDCAEREAFLALSTLVQNRLRSIRITRNNRD